MKWNYRKPPFNSWTWDEILGNGGQLEKTLRTNYIH